MNYLLIFVILGAYAFVFIIWKVTRKIKSKGDYNNYYFIGINLLTGILGGVVIIFQADFIKFNFEVKNGYPYSIILLIFCILILRAFYLISNRQDIIKE